MHILKLLKVGVLINKPLSYSSSKFKFHILFSGNIPMLTFPINVWPWGALLTIVSDILLLK